MAKNVEDIKAYVDGLVKKSRIAQQKFEREYNTQRAVDEVVRAVGMAVLNHQDEIAELAVTESKMGTVEEEKLKFLSIASANWNFLRGKPSVGEVSNIRPDEPGVRVLAKPLGVIGCLIPSTNPTGTVIGNGMVALKARNSVIIAPHPMTARTSYEMSEYIRAELKEIGAPEDLVLCIEPEMCSIEATTFMLHSCDANIGTGGPGMVKAVYSSGKPGFGVGQGNCQVLLDDDFPDFGSACSAIVANRTFQNGVPCTSEQTVHVPAAREKEFLKAMDAAGAYLVTDPTEISKLKELIFPMNGPINREIVGRPIQMIADMVKINVPDNYKAILIKNQVTDGSDVLCQEILAPFLRYTTYEKFEDGIEAAVTNLEVQGGAGHSSSIWSIHPERIDQAALRIPVARFHINQPTVGYQNGLPTTVTMGCGAWGGNSICENLQYYHLMDFTRITTTVPNLRNFDPSDWDKFDICKVTVD
jgi:succinate-semialdehyde dehydrogenase